MSFRRVPNWLLRSAWRENALLAIVCLLAAGVCSAIAGETPVVISGAKANADGILVHEVTSPFQAGVTRIKLLCPDRLDSKRACPVVYVLPVEAGEESRYGDGLLEVKKNNLQNRYGAIFVSPTFSQLPWYADHPTDHAIRQEAYFLNVVVPFVETHYPVRREAAGRLLLGFSKSGWGAYSLLLRHPDLFGKAAAWDAPMMMDKPGKYGSGPIFGTQENFEQYQITRLLEAQAGRLHSGDRLILLGYGNFREEHQALHALMDRLKIAHVYRDGPPRKHVWGSGWLPEAVKLFFEDETEAATRISHSE